MAEVELAGGGKKVEDCGSERMGLPTSREQMRVLDLLRCQTCKRRYVGAIQGLERRE